MTDSCHLTSIIIPKSRLGSYKRFPRVMINDTYRGDSPKRHNGHNGRQKPVRQSWNCILGLDPRTVLQTGQDIGMAHVNLVFQSYSVVQ